MNGTLFKTLALVKVLFKALNKTTKKNISNEGVLSFQKSKTSNLLKALKVKSKEF
jgi:hypothetical protein